MAGAAQNNTAALQRKDAAHYWHPFTDSAALGAGARIIQRAQGVYVWDTDGNQLLDGMSGLWCVNMGYGRAELAEAAAAQLRELPYYNSFFQSATPAAILLAEALAEVSPPGFNRVFFAGGGSEANDTVVRLIRYYWQKKGEPQRKIIVSRRNAYHGSTIAAASLGGMAAMHAQGGLPIADVEHVCQPYRFAEGGGMEEAEFGAHCARDLAAKLDELGAENVAAFIAEPVQGAGGVIVPPSNYWREVQAVCDSRGVPIVADEVICGFGRLGAWFGAQHYGIRPMLMPIAKGLTSGYLPMGGVLAHDEIARVVADGGGEFAHGFTFGGHPVCAAVALANIRLMQAEDIVRRVRDETAPYFQSQWQTLAAHPLVAESRGVGMVAAIELARPNGERFASQPAAGVLCRELSLAQGLIMRAVGDIMIVAPPLVITRAQIDELVGKARAALDALAERLRPQ